MSNCMCMALRPAKRTQYFNVKSHNIGKTVSVIQGQKSLKLTFHCVTTINQLCLSRQTAIQPVLVGDVVFAFTRLYFPARYRW